MKLLKAFSLQKSDAPKQLVKYIVIGLLVFITDFLSLILLVELLNLQILLAASISYIAGVAIHFNLNRQWNFKNFDRKYHHQLKTYLVATIIFYFINITTIKILLLVNVHYTLSKIVATVLLAMFTFLFNKHITFNKGIRRFLKDALKIS